MTRIVVLPDFQGIGLGTRLASRIAEHETRLFGLKSFSITSSNAFFLSSLLKSGVWLRLEKDVCASASSKERKIWIKSFGKIIVTLRYSGRESSVN